MKTLDSETVRNNAALARLSFGPAESEKLAVELQLGQGKLKPGKVNALLVAELLRRQL